MTTTRFAPSPTGYIHIGNLRAALFNHAIARQAGARLSCALTTQTQSGPSRNISTVSWKI